MNFVLHTTAFGPPTTALLAGQVQAAKGPDRLAPVTVIVPSNYAAVSTRRELAGVSQHRLPHSVSQGRTAGRGGRGGGAPAGSTPVLAQAVRSVLAAEPGVFAPVAERPATLAPVSSTQELAGLTEGVLDAEAARRGRAAGVVSIARDRFGPTCPSGSTSPDLIVSVGNQKPAGTVQVPGFTPAFSRAGLRQEAKWLFRSGARSMAGTHGGGGSRGRGGVQFVGD